ncbi:hypothetical protein [Thalassobius sp. Cn5-15]|uniref:hypothetical protein n=1 Tax=Thalassobius sp. Cn5-15 TaxID=2917763 RepID=UPI001EF373BB|nr:hypothetical protein [Thalassobius sp. Cn5-15]MCG7492480.1 hypothetical protein [Thalassobius sp. Cn5-15]
MAFQLTDRLPLNRGGTPGDGDSGDYYVETVTELKKLIAAISADAGNLLTNGTDDGVFLNKAAVEAAVDAATLAYNAGTNILTFTDHNGAPTTIDLSALTTDVYVNGASINGAGQLVLTDNDGGTADITVDLSSYINSVTDNQAAGTVTLASAGGSTVVKKTAWMSAPTAP